MATTTISITIPTTELERIESGLCASAGIPTSAANANAAFAQGTELWFVYKDSNWTLESPILGAGSLTAWYQ